MLLPKAVRYMNNEELEELERLEGQFQRAVAAGNLPETLEARRAFYLFIFRLARNPEALDVIDRSWTVIDILRLRHGVDPTRLERSMAAHKQLMRALSRRDAGAALSVILTSNERTKEALLTIGRESCRERRWPSG